MKNLLIILLSIFFFSPSKANIIEKKPVEIKVNIDSSQEFHIGDNMKDALILTKGNNPYLSDVPANILMLNDGYIIYDINQTLTKFDSKGRFVTSINYESNIDSSKPINVNIKNDSIFIFDLNNSQVFIYDRNGIFLNQKSTKQKNERNNFGSLLPLKNQYIGAKSYQINDTKTGLSKSEFAIYDSNFEYIANIYSPLGAHLDLSRTTSNCDILVADLFTSDIFSINKERAFEKKYTVDFQKYSLPNNYITRHNLLDVITTKGKSYVLGLIVLNESDNYLIFQYIFGDKIHFAVYDKINKKTHSFRITDSDLSSNEPLSFKFTVRNLIVMDDIMIFYLQSNKSVAISKVKIKDII